MTPTGGAHLPERGREGRGSDGLLGLLGWNFFFFNNFFMKKLNKTVKNSKKF